jgi:hypothetical protein
VGLSVEHPVLQREHIIFREQKIEVSVHRGKRQGTRHGSEPGVGWLKPVILATQEAEIRRITV